MLFNCSATSQGFSIADKTKGQQRSRSPEVKTNPESKPGVSKIKIIQGKHQPKFKNKTTDHIFKTTNYSPTRQTQTPNNLPFCWYQNGNKKRKSFEAKNNKPDAPIRMPPVNTASGFSLNHAGCVC